MRGLRLGRVRDGFGGRRRRHHHRRVEAVAEAVEACADDTNAFTLTSQINYARALYHNPSATLDDVREALMTLEETERTARRVLGAAHPEVVKVERNLRAVRAALAAARETPSPEAS